MARSSTRVKTANAATNQPKKRTTPARPKEVQPPNKFRTRTSNRVTPVVAPNTRGKRARDEQTIELDSRALETRPRKKARAGTGESPYIPRGTKRKSEQDDTNHTLMADGPAASTRSNAKKIRLAPPMPPTNRPTRRLPAKQTTKQTKSNPTKSTAAQTKPAEPTATRATRSSTRHTQQAVSEPASTAPLPSPKANKNKGRSKAKAAPAASDESCSGSSNQEKDKPNQGKKPILHKSKNKVQGRQSPPPERNETCTPAPLSDSESIESIYNPSQHKQPPLKKNKGKAKSKKNKNRVATPTLSGPSNTNPIASTSSNNPTARSTVTEPPGKKNKIPTQSLSPTATSPTASSSSVPPMPSTSAMTGAVGRPVVQSGGSARLTNPAHHDLFEQFLSQGVAIASDNSDPHSILEKSVNLEFAANMGMRF